MDTSSKRCTAFAGGHRIATGSYLDVALALNASQSGPHDAMALIFDDATGKQIDFDLSGTAQDVTARLQTAPSLPDSSQTPRGPGRPKLGVISREVTLLPRHWDWLARQPGGASVALRKLVEAATRDSRLPTPAARDREMRDRAYHIMSALAGNLPGFEEATRALFAGDRPAFSTLVRNWPDDVRAYLLQLAFDTGDRVTT